MKSAVGQMTEDGLFDKENYTYDESLLTVPEDQEWTMARIRAWVAAGKMTTQVIVPHGTEEVSWQGVKVYLTAGQPIEVPDPIAMVWRNSFQHGMQAPVLAKAVLDRRAFVAGGTSVEQGWNGNQ